MLKELLILYLFIILSSTFLVYFAIQFWRFSITKRLVKETILYVFFTIVILSSFFVVKNKNYHKVYDVLQAHIDNGYRIINVDKQDVVPQDIEEYVKGYDISFMQDFKEIIVEKNEEEKEYSYILGYGNTRYDLIPLSLFKDREISKQIMDYIGNGYQIVIDNRLVDAQTSNGLVSGYEIKINEKEKKLSFSSRPQMVVSCFVDEDGYPYVKENSIQYKNQRNTKAKVK